MRPGELTGLRWDNVDLDTGVISILESLKNHGGQLSQGSTKTKQSRRKLKALPIAITALKAHQERQQADRLAAGAWWTDTGYVFTTEVGTPINPANLRRAFRALVKAAGIPAKQPTEDIPDPGQWHPNEMRHSAAATWTTWASPGSGSPTSSATKERALPKRSTSIPRRSST
jgi:integrase